MTDFVLFLCAIIYKKFILLQNNFTYEMNPNFFLFSATLPQLPLFADPWETKKMAVQGFVGGNPRESNKMADHNLGNPTKRKKMADQGQGSGGEKPRDIKNTADLGSSCGNSKKSNVVDQGFGGRNPAKTMADEDCLSLKTIAKELMRKNENIKDFAVPVCLDELRKSRTKINKKLLENWIESGIKEGLKHHQSIISGIVTQVCQIIQVRKKDIILPTRG